MQTSLNPSTRTGHTSSGSITLTTDKGKAKSIDGRRSSIGSSLKQLPDSLKKLLPAKSNPPLSPPGRSKPLDFSESSSGRSSQEWTPGGKKATKLHLNFSALFSGTSASNSQDPSPHSQNTSPRTPLSPPNQTSSNSQTPRTPLTPSTPHTPVTPQTPRSPQINRRSRYSKNTPVCPTPPCTTPPACPTPPAFEYAPLPDLSSIDEFFAAKCLPRSQSFSDLRSAKKNPNPFSCPASFEIPCGKETISHRGSVVMPGGFYPHNVPRHTSGDFRFLLNAQVPPKILDQKELSTKDIKYIFNSAMKIWSRIIKPEVTSKMITERMQIGGSLFVYHNLYKNSPENRERSSFVMECRERTKEFFHYIYSSGFLIEPILERLQTFEHCFEKMRINENISKEHVKNILDLFHMLTNKEEFVPSEWKQDKETGLKKFLKTIDEIQSDPTKKLIWGYLKKCIGDEPDSVLHALKNCIWVPNNKSKELESFAFTIIEKAINLISKLKGIPFIAHNWMTSSKGIDNLFKTTWINLSKDDAVIKSTYEESIKYMQKGKPWRIVLPKSINEEKLIATVDRYKDVILTKNLTWIKDKKEQKSYLQSLCTTITLADIVRVHSVDNQEHCYEKILAQTKISEIINYFRPLNLSAKTEAQNTGILSLTINNEPFFSETIVETSQHNEFSYFKLLVARLYQCGLDPHKIKIGKLQREMENFQTYGKFRQVEGSEFEWTFLPAVAVPKNWKTAHDYFVFLYPELFPKINTPPSTPNRQSFIPHLVTQEVLGTTECAFNIVTKTMFEVSVKKIYSISLKVQSDNEIIEIKLANCPVCWTVKFNDYEQGETPYNKQKLMEAELKISELPTFVEEFPSKFKHECQKHMTRLFKILAHPKISLI